jgi:hypothetical protein
MSSSKCIKLAVVLLGLGAPAGGFAQYIPSPASPVYGARPAYSPYLNLNRGGINPAFNYYGLVRPEIEARTAYQGLQIQVNQVRQEAQSAQFVQEQGDLLPATGYTARFFDYGRYFPGGAPGQLGTRGLTGLGGTAATTNRQPASAAGATPRRGR